MKKVFLIIILYLFVSFISIAAGGDAQDAAAGHADPVVPVLIYFSIILLAAKLGGEIFERINQPAVLGELLFGVILGNLGLIIPGYNLFDALRVEHITEHWAIVINSIASIGVIILLFEVGFESTLSDMKKVGTSSFLVATVGVICPFILGYIVSNIFIQEVPETILKMAPNFAIYNIHIFIGATLCVTSVGITARVLQDMNLIQAKESRIVIGAAIIDDIMGLLILAVVSNMIISAETGAEFNAVTILTTALYSILFLVLAVFLGMRYVSKLFHVFTKMRIQGMLLIASLLFCFVLSILANLVGLATIIGASVAGLILEESHFKGFKDSIRLEQYLKPIASIFVPVFFIQMGVQVRLETFLDPSVFGIAFCLIVAAFVGKQFCSIGVVEKGLNRAFIGVGMVPRGEVGLIFAGIGKALNVIDDGLFSAIVIMVMVTTLITPPLLKLTWKKFKGSYHVE